MRPGILVLYIWCLAVFASIPVLATPSTTYFTPCTIDIQPAGVTHLGVDNFFEVGTSSPTGEFATDIGPSGAHRSRRS